MTTRKLMEPDQIFPERFGTAPRWSVRAPGSINLLGEQVAHQGGVVLSAAIDRQVTLAAAPTAERAVTLYALDLDQTVTFSLDALDSHQDRDGSILPQWAQYPAGVAWALQESGLTTGGLRGVFNSNLPSCLEAGSAVEVAFAIAWQQLGGWKTSASDLARLCQRAEIAYLGKPGALAELFTSACGVRGHLLYFDTQSLEYRLLPLPEGSAIVITDAGISTSDTLSLANEVYAAHRQACAEAVYRLQVHKPGLHSLREITSVELAAFADTLPEIPRKRAEHVTKEMLRVEQAVSALERQDAPHFGGLMYATHRSLRDLYQVSRPELDLLVQLSRQIPGCYGAHLTGTGYRDCTVHLVEAASALSFIQALHAEYLRQTGLDASIYLCQVVDGASARKI